MSLSKTAKDLLIIASSTLLLTFLIWLPFLLKLPSFFNLDFSPGFNLIYRNFDGIEYITIAKSWYDPQIIARLPQSLSANYYAAHFPGYSLLILLFAPFLGFLKSMLFVSVTFTVLAAIAFYFLVRDLKLTDHPLLLSLIFLILPARWVIVHSVGSSEPVFIFLIIMVFYCLLRYESLKSFIYLFLSALFAMLALLTRPPGAIVLIAIGLYVLWRYFISVKVKDFSTNFSQAFRYLIFIIGPLALLGLFYWFSLTYQNFWAYFNSGDNIHLVFPPFQIFNKHQYWVGEIWLEDIIYIFVFGLMGGIYLWKKKLYPLAFFVFTYIIASMFIAHRDISRYVLPIFPFVLIAFEKLLTSKEFRVVLIILGLAIYLYSQNFLIENVAPYPNIELFN
jgi:hypothetical protein